MNKIDAILSRNIKLMRKKKSWSLEDLANESGLSWGAVQNIESGRSWPGLKSLRAICKALNVKETEIFKDPDDKSISPKEATKALCKHFKISITE